MTGQLGVALSQLSDIELGFGAVVDSEIVSSTYSLSQAVVLNIVSNHAQTSTYVPASTLSPADVLGPHASNVYDIAGGGSVLLALVLNINLTSNLHQTSVVAPNTVLNLSETSVYAPTEFGTPFDVHTETPNNTYTLSGALIGDFTTFHTDTSSYILSGAMSYVAVFTRSLTSNYIPTNSSTCVDNHTANGTSVYSPSGTVILGPDTININVDHTYFPFNVLSKQIKLNVDVETTYSPSETAIGFQIFLGSGSNTYTPTGDVEFVHVDAPSIGNTYIPSQSVSVVLKTTYATSNIYVPLSILMPHLLIHDPDMEGTLTWVEDVVMTRVILGPTSNLSLLSQVAEPTLDVSLPPVTNTYAPHGAAVLGPDTLNISVESTYVPISQVNIYWSETVTSTITWTGVATGIATLGSIETYVPIGTVGIALVTNLSVGNVYAPTGTTASNAVIGRPIVDGSGYNQSVHVSKVNFRSVGNYYAPQGGQVFFNVTAETLTPQDIGLSQTLVSTHIQHYTVTSDYLPVGNPTPTQKKSFSLSNNLTFLTTNSPYVPLASLGNIVVPNLIYTQILGYQTVPPFMGVPSSPRKVFPFCTLQVPQLAITLPAPEFNDSEAYAGIFTIRRSMNGNTVTYVHRLNTSKLKYDFLIGLPKMFELERYLLNYNSSTHTLTNWKGEIWIVLITNNPMEFSSKRRYSNGLGDSFDDIEQVAVTLEFEGTRIH